MCSSVTRKILKPSFSSTILTKRVKKEDKTGNVLCGDKHVGGGSSMVLIVVHLF